MKRFVVIAILVAALGIVAIAASPGQSDKQPGSAIALPTQPDTSSLKIALDVSQAGPRPIEDTTEKAIVRDYGNAWSAMASALEQNRAPLLAGAFTGAALDNLTQRVRQQMASGLRTRYIDRGHKLQAVFYSPEGSAMQLRDAASYEVELLDGDRVVSRQQFTAHYVAVMTVGEERWKVRVLQAVPGE